jgi:CopA family copper-resistance protein
VAFVLALMSAAPAPAATYDLVVEERTVNITGRERPATMINGQIPGPVLRFKEGEDAVIHVTNRLKELTSIHWHGIILPSAQDGVPGVSDGFQGIKPGETFTYRSPIKQAGTYWYHSHSAGQEQTGMYAPIIIDPARREPFRYDREYVLMFSDWTDERPERIVSNLKMDPGYYNYNKRTLVDLFRSLGRAETWDERKSILADRWMFGQMRMDPTDIADVSSGYTFLVNGHAPDKNFTALFTPGERIRLRFINASAMSYLDVRIPGLKMTVVQADGNNVEPVPVDEFRIAVAETYDVIVRPTEDKAYAILAESIERSGFARATLATRAGEVGAIPPHRPRPVLTMADMGSSFGPTGLDRGTIEPEEDRPGHIAPMDMDHGAHGYGAAPAPDHAKSSATDHAHMGHGSAPDPLANDTGAPADAKVLSYRDLKAMASPFDTREPDRVIEMRLTGNMERFFWSMNGRKFSEAQPIVLRYGERVRFKFINETMMNHAMHLHGMWMLPRIGNAERDPLKHVINVKPGAVVEADVPVDAEGSWAFHCHLLYHMETGMMRKVIVQREPRATTTPAPAAAPQGHGAHH